jgi:hypothetical protein
MSSGGPGPRGAMATMSQYMLSSAATFGFFMSIGSVSLSILRDIFERASNSERSQTGKGRNKLMIQVIRTDSPYPLPADRMRMLQANSPIAGAWRRNVEVEVKPSRI